MFCFRVAELVNEMRCYFFLCIQRQLGSVDGRDELRSQRM
uniref:Uncharacterized protein n=1 Tax=Arundo donax TaxID=35708 RepID=A0A0A9HPV9_ARUDO